MAMSTASTTGMDQRRAARFVRAERHSRLVRRLRWLLPGAAVMVFGLFVLASWLSTFVEGVSIGPLRLQGSSLVMASPRVSGFDSQRRPYELTAVSARQDVREPRKVELDSLDARMGGLTGNASVRVTADRGYYDGEVETFRAEGNVRVTSTLGYEMRLEEAFVDIRAQTMVSERPVEGRYGDDRVFADRLNSTRNGEVVVFDGNVQVIFNPSGDGQ
jgi:lipopolysaccharide export system protein LptC